MALIGANGAGKSTLMMTIFGNPRARDGSIIFDGRDITHLPTHEIARLKIAQAPEGRRIFVRMTVMENLQMGAPRWPTPLISTPISRASLRCFRACKERIDQRGGTLSGGEQQMLAIARALMGRPRLLLLDEPSLGLAPLVARQIFDAIRTLNTEEKLTVFLVEQNAFHALEARASRLCHGQRPDHADRHRARAAGPAGGEGRLSRRRKALDCDGLLDPRISLRGALARRVSPGDRHPRRRRRLAYRPRHRRTWRPWWHVALYMLLLGAAVRFLHFALFDATLLVAARLSGRNAVCLVFGFLGFRLTRVDADGQPLRLDQRACRAPALAPPRDTAAGDMPKSG